MKEESEAVPPETVDENESQPKEVMDEFKKKVGVTYIETDVYTEAKKRINHVLDTFDKLFVCFSGGKDSLVVLNLVEEAYRENGINEPVNVIFRDEELIPDDVINFVDWHVQQQDRFRFYYYAVQLKSTKFILGKTYDYLQWDESREWIRRKPDYAITAPGRIFDQYSMDAFCGEGHRGKLAFLTGVRADESIVRFKALTNKVNENYIAGCESPNIKLVKPIFDWSQNDVFKYFHDQGIKYCPIYDHQVWNGMALRVATPLHAESAKRFDKLKTLYPTFYQQLVTMFPEMLVQERYWSEYNRDGIIFEYDHSWNGILQYCREHITEPHQRALAVKRILMCKTIRDNKLARGEGLHNFGGYPLLYVFKSIMAGQDAHS